MDEPAGDPPLTTRQWLHCVRDQLAPLLPARHKPPLVTEELVTADGSAVDVFRHFNTDPNTLSALLGNFYGLQHTAQCAHGSNPVREPPAWQGFQDVWIPVAPGVRLFGRLGLATRAGRPTKADCIVVLPGLFGDLQVERTRTIAAALVLGGFHTLAVELRGYGQTDAAQPDTPSTFGVLEAGDLLALAEQLQARPEVRRTGLIGFCWGANLALLAAWEDGRAADHPSVSARLRPFLHQPSGMRHYEAGVLAFSPVLAFEDVIDRCYTPTPFLKDPVLNALEDRICDRKREKGYRPIDGNLRALIDDEFARSALRFPGATEDGLDYLRLLPPRGRPAGNKLESARIPVLIVHASNDPTASAQAVAEFATSLENPNVGVMLLEGGGHVGFAAYARDWFYSLILGYFGRTTPFQP